ncbi:hypothetical protein [Arsenophonus apicola]|uniref:hypothetical protein n=1 Tax=Arsenophonus apicola TaxID=2879119 RepID=UPI00387A127B
MREIPLICLQMQRTTLGLRTVNAGPGQIKYNCTSCYSIERIEVEMALGLDKQVSSNK